MENKVFKNWPAICAVQDKFVKWAIACLNLNSELGQRIAKQLPEYFTDQEVLGPIPLSVMRQKALEYARTNGGDLEGGHEFLFLVSYEAIPTGVPVLSFDLYGRNQIGRDFPILPSGISPHAEQGEVVVWEGKKFVVLENNDSCEEMHLAPAELIDVDCPVRIPLSALMDAAEEYSREDSGYEERLVVADRHFALNFAGHKHAHLSLPVAHRFGDDGHALPGVIMDQLIGKKAEAGIVVTYHGKEYLIVSICFNGDNSPPIGSVIDRDVLKKIDSLLLAPAELVNLNR